MTLKFTKQTLVILLTVLFTDCNNEDSETKIDFFGKWKIQEIVLSDLTSDIQKITASYDQCLIDDIFEFTTTSKFNIYDYGIECNPVTKLYDNEIEILRNNENKIVAFQVLPIVDEVYHPIIESNYTFYISIINIDNMEMSNLIRCPTEVEGQEFCMRIIRLKRL